MRYYQNLIFYLNMNKKINTTKIFQFRSSSSFQVVLINFSISDFFRFSVTPIYASFHFLVSVFPQFEDSSLWIHAAGRKKYHGQTFPESWT